AILINYWGFCSNFNAGALCFLWKIYFFLIYLASMIKCVTENLSSSGIYCASFVRLGERKYIQAGTLVDHLLTAVKTWSLGSLEDLVMECRQMLFSHAKYVLLTADDSKPDDFHRLSCLFKITCSKKKKYQVAVIADNSTIVPPAVAFNEGELLLGSCINTVNRAIVLREWICDDQRSILPLLIAMNKYLLQTLLPTTKYTAWVFCGVNLKWNKITAAINPTIMVKLEKVLGHIAACSSIFIDDDYIGRITFSRQVISS
ncbi:MAG: hypothetical protein AABY34_02930, partial [Pseudomonadota bacterium]